MLLYVNQKRGTFYEPSYQIDQVESLLKDHVFCPILILRKTQQ
jgi:hypothetical protein